MTDKKNQPAEKTRLSWSWLRMALSLREKIKLGDKQVIFIWAVVVGALGALMALVFEMGVELVQDVLTGRTSYRQIQVFQEMASQDPAWCIFVPAAGGLLAGLTLLFTHALCRPRRRNTWKPWRWAMDTCLPSPAFCVPCPPFSP
nr:hypothetical protein [Akkermansia muciniphila]